MTADRRVRIATWCLRAVAAVHAVTVVGQPILAGLLMDGDTSMLATHSDHGMIAVGLAACQLAAAVWWYALTRRRPAVLWTCVGILIAEAVQIYLGFARVVGLHVPLGTAIVVASVVVLVPIWRPAGELRQSSGSGQ